MKRILLTGMSGTGKSTITSELAVRGYKAVDLDCDTFSEWVELNGASETPGSPVASDRDWMWRADRVHELLSTEDADVLFLSGCASNMGQFLPRFNYVVLLSAPPDVIVERLKKGVSVRQRRDCAGSRCQSECQVTTLRRRRA